MKLVILLAAALGGVYAQTISGSIVGTVLDSSGNSIPNAAVKLQSERTGEERSATANDAGDFLFPALQPGAYTISVEQAGFRPLRKTGNMLSAAERMPAGNLTLQVGSVSSIRHRLRQPLGRARRFDPAPPPATAWACSVRSCPAPPGA